MWKQKRNCYFYHRHKFVMILSQKNYDVNESDEEKSNEKNFNVR